jgi:hypothetical protein
MFTQIAILFEVVADSALQAHAQPAQTIGAAESGKA